MSELLSLDNLFTLAMLIFLQVVLGFDNLLYISIESKRVRAERQAFVRRVGIGLAIGFRIALLFLVVEAIESFRSVFFAPHWEGVIEAGFTVHAAIVLAGGAFIMYTAVKEIMHMLSIEDLGHDTDRSSRSVAAAISWIVAMNLVFSFDSILGAIALTDVFAVMAIAIVFSGILMIALADRVADFLKRNRAYEVLGLFILLVVGVMLVSEGGHLAHMKLFDQPVEAMTKSTFYFSIVILVLVDLAQSRYQRKLAAIRAAGAAGARA